ncbi:MAG TPA: DUF2155 domain-containing protein [Stellaceae bacterium]|nr:DUF2155 domain-containing protein [Stellaceae bacterium]
MRGRACALLAGLALLIAAPLAHAQTAAPATAVAPQMIAVLQGLDKTTARVTTFDAPVGRSVKFGSLVITARACNKQPPEEAPNTSAFLQIDDTRSSSGSSARAERVFSGWMFAESPSLSALEHPVYDVTLLDCKTATGSAPK